jgi:hypothetical protein
MADTTSVAHATLMAMIIWPLLELVRCGVARISCSTPYARIDPPKARKRCSTWSVNQVSNLLMTVSHWLDVVDNLHAAAHRWDSGRPKHVGNNVPKHQ